MAIIETCLLVLDSCERGLEWWLDLRAVAILVADPRRREGKTLFATPLCRQFDDSACWVLLCFMAQRGMKMVVGEQRWSVRWAEHKCVQRRKCLG